MLVNIHDSESQFFKVWKAVNKIRVGCGIYGKKLKLNQQRWCSTYSQAGNIRIRTSGKEENLVIDGGLVEVLDNKVIVLAEAIIEK